MTEKREIAIRVSGVKKKYRLGAISGRTLQEDLQSWWALKRGREDPNSPVLPQTGRKEKEFYALNGIDLTVYRGERLGIIGLNGAGKSTLLKLLSRITAPTEGEIDIWGRMSSLLEVGTGFHREMTGRENIYMNGAILGMNRAEIDAKLDRIIAFSEVQKFIDTPVKRYSSGMFVKLAFSVAAFLDSEILVMDEVLAVGDMAFQRKCLDRMREAAEAEGRTILYVSHNMDTIRRLCDRCIVLDCGKIIYDGEPEQAISLYLNRNVEPDSADMDLRRKDPDPAGDLALEHLTLPEKTLPVYAPGEALRLRLTVRAAQREENLILRLTFRDETDIAIGTAWSEPFCLPEAGSFETEFTMPCGQIAKGGFYVSLGLFRRDEIGTPHCLTHITRAFHIEMTGLPVWDLRSHGYVSFEPVKVSAVSRKLAEMLPENPEQGCI